MQLHEVNENDDDDDDDLTLCCILNLILLLHFLNWFFSPMFAGVNGHWVVGFVI